MTEKEVHLESEAESEEEVETGVTFVTVLNRILKSDRPLSEENPGYLIGFVNFLREEDIPARLENFLPGLTKAAKCWLNASQSRLKHGSLEYLSSLKSQLGTWYEMSLDSTANESLKSCLASYVATNITSVDRDWETTL